MTQESSTDKELTYHGRPLDPQPVNLPLGFVAQQLLAGKTIQVILEPGDATRYDFILSPIALNEENFDLVSLEALFVGRTLGLGGELVASAIIRDPSRDEWQYERGVEEISLFKTRAGNEWSAQFFNWWFRKLWERING
jgi:hypothetical protein